MKFGAGEKRARLEDGRLITGGGRYADDLSADGQLYLGFLRAAVAHAKILSLDLEAVRAAPGIVAAYDAADLAAAGMQPIPILRDYPGPNPGDGRMLAPERLAIASDHIRYVGEILAAVVGESRAAVEDALDQAWLETEDLPVLANIEAAIMPDAALVHPAAGSNIVTGSRFGDKAKVAEIFAAAAHTSALRLTNQRVFPAPLEPRSALAVPDPTNGRLTLHSACQNPTAMLKQLAETLNRPPESLRVKVPDIGGGFGMKGYLYPEEALVAFCALQLGRPVKWRGSRLDDFLGATHARDQLCDVEAAFDAEYRILALRCRTMVNLGAYPGPAGPILALTLGPKVATNIYDIPAIDIEVKGVLTNTQSTAPYRGAGRPEAIYATERLLDHAAATFGIDPAELRRRNLIRPESIPYRTAIGETYDSGNFPAILDRMLELADWQGFANRKADSAAKGKLRGRGLSMFIEWTGGNSFTETIRIEIRPDGSILAESATIPMGQGLHTSFAQMLAAIFEVEAERVILVTGDTDVANGFGSFGSRSLYVGGSAMALGGHEALRVFRGKAADHLEAAAEDVEYARGIFRVSGTDRLIGLFDLAGAQPEGKLSLPFTHTIKGESWPNGAHVCELEIDPDTGLVEIQRYSCVDDVGIVINPMIVEGQIQGGVMQGIGQALLEQVIYDSDTGQLLTATLLDYCLPRASDVSFIHSELDQRWPSRNNPLGAKGAGESGTVGAPPAVMAAVLDALRPLGVQRMDMPATPDRIWAAIQAAQAKDGA